MFWCRDEIFTFVLNKTCKIVEHSQSTKEKAEMQRQIDELQASMENSSGGIWDGIVNFLKDTISTIVPTMLTTLLK